MSTRETFERFAQTVRQIGDIKTASSVLQWDQETYMPPHGAEGRGRVLATLAGQAHEMLTSRELGRLIDELSEAKDLDARQAANVREVKRDRERATKVPRDLVERLSKAASKGLEVWKHARSTKRFAFFAPDLEKIVDLQRELAEAYGYKGHLYDALVEGFEPGARVADLDPLFQELREFLVPLVRAIQDSSHGIDTSILKGDFPEDRQKKFGLDTIAAIGFDLQAGRVDVSAHPFCSGFSPSDVRLTTRYSPKDLRPAVFGLLHEAGHGIYEQGLNADERGLPTGQSVSMGIHESQSRLWENVVGRSRPFWQKFFPSLESLFSRLFGRNLDDFYRAINAVEPSFIRVEADEVTYNLHIILRYELEKALLTKELAVKDLPGAWNERMKELLGIVPPDDSLGVLQDVHWAMGAFGYFPTYTLGNLYAAQLFAQAKLEIPTLEKDIAAGRFGPLRDWLREKVHRNGRLHLPGKLIQEITSQPLTAQFFCDYLRQKYGSLYQLS
ncbi:MAG: carboxypeptidase M32 [Planctomycetota bacterium]